MPSITPAELEKLIDQATSETIPNGEIDLIKSLEVSDIIKSKSLPPQQCLKLFIKKINAVNQGTADLNAQLSAWRLVDICLKNGGELFIKELLSNEFIKVLETSIVKAYTNKYNDVELFQVQSQVLYDMKNYCEDSNKINYPYTNPKKLWNKLQDSENVLFPYDKLVKNDVKTFDSRQPADWVDSDSCMICFSNFTMFNRKHHCRACGGTYCQKHSSNTIPLLDLGILEPVRVCDNCFEDYGSKSEKHHKKNKKKKDATKDHERPSKNADSFDEDIRKAIELSLRASVNNPTTEPIIPTVYHDHEYVQDNTQEQNDHIPDENNEDEELKKAIEMSLQEAELQKVKQLQEHEVVENRIRAQTPPLPMPLPVSPNEISTQDEDDIYLFASLVEKLKTQPLHVVLQDAKLSQLYSNITNLKRKLGLELQETNQKYNDFVGMNNKISNIMNMYDGILESQLQSINLQQNQSILQPSDPYSYYQQYQQPQTVETPVQQPIAQQPVAQQPITQPPVSHQLQNLVFHEPQLQESEPPMLEESEPALMEESAPQESASQESAPYPVEERIQPKGITNINFPTVPVTKPPVFEKHDETEEEEHVEEETVQDEPALIEL